MSFVKTLRFRIAATYLALVIVSSVILFGFLYFMIEQTLKDKDRRIIESEFNRLTLIANDQHALERSYSGDAFVRLIDPSGKVLFEHDPAILRELDPQVFRRDIDAAKPGTYTRTVAPNDDEDAVEYMTGLLPNGNRLQVGKDTEDREELLEKFQNAFAIVLAVALVTALGTSLLFSRSILRPVRNLIATMTAVRKGDRNARAVTVEDGDEINEVGVFLNAMLDQNSKLIDALTNSLDAVAHDLRTPLTRLRAQAERGLQHGQQTELLGEMMENTDQVIELLDAIFETSEAEAGTLKLKIQRFSVRQLLEDVIDVYSIVAEEKQISIHLDLQSDFEISCDIRVKQAVANLLDNAIKFSPVNSVVTVRARHERGYSIIGVEDQGTGVADDEREKIWERLFRGDQSRSTRGMGLGLSLVRAVANAHGGHASLHERNRFEIHLPDESFS